MNPQLCKFIVRLFGLMLLAACAPQSIPNTPTPPPATAAPAMPTLAPTSTAAPLPTRVALPTVSLATTDPSIGMLPTFDFSTFITATPSAIVTALPTIPVDSPFEFVATLDDILPGSQGASFQPASDGTIWMITNAGIARLGDSGGIAYLSKHEGHFVGMDTLGRAWSINPTNMAMTDSCLGPSGPCLINPDMDSISTWDGKQWTRYASESGWTNFSVVSSPSPNFSMAELDGQIWLSTSVDVRVFDGSRWSVIKLEEIGLTPPYSLLTVQAFAGTKEIWVKGCDFIGPGPNKSEIYVYDGSKWQNRSVPEDSGCLTRMQEDRQGNVWLAADKVLWRFTHATEEWIKFTPPAPGPPNNITSLALNKAGEPWLTTLTCDEASASCNGSTLYHLQNDVWLPTIPFNSHNSSVGVFIDSADQVWTTTRDGIYRVVDDHPILVSHLNISFSPLTMDSTGRIWAIGKDSSSANDKLSLWVVNP
jgi:hypothetical protein